MADVSKSQKLASARKKFKELKKKKNAANKTNEEEKVAPFITANTPLDSLTSSTHSSINEQSAPERSYNDNYPEPAPVDCQSETAQLPNYFNDDVYCPEPSSFFDNISQNVDQRNVAREKNRSDSGIFNYPKECGIPSVNTFNTYSFQYDTPFKDQVPYEDLPEPPQEDEDTLQSNTELLDDYSSNKSDNLANTNTYFTENYSDSNKNAIVIETLDVLDDKQLHSPLESEPENFGKNKNEGMDLRADNMQADGQNVHVSQDYAEDQSATSASPLDEEKRNDTCYHNIFPNQGRPQQIGNDPLHIEKQEQQNVFQDESIYQPFSHSVKIDYPSGIENVEVPSESVSNVESLLQLSNQMAQLVEPNNEYGIQNEVSELEKRNIELAARLDKERLKTDQLTANIGDYQHRIGELERKLNDKLSGNNFAEMNEVSRLREELQSHIQTIGMLVAEKTEISANAGQFELILKQKTTECEELQNRLKASRSRVSDLERENSFLKDQFAKLKDNELDRHMQLSRINEECKTLKEEKEEISQDLLEAKEKLKTAAENNINLQKQVQELKSNLSLANIKIQQLTTTESHQIDVQVEKLMQDKFALDKKLADLTQTLKTVTKERDDSSSQYHQYTQQLNAQLANLAKKLQQLQCENELLVAQEQSRVKHISDLERQLQNLQNDQSNFSNQKATGDYKKEFLLALDNFQTIQASKAKLEENYTKISNEKDMLLRDLESKKQTIVHLEDLMEQVRQSQPDNNKLLAAMESDKVAASRAMSQNIELKKQMEGMQEVLMKLNNDKVELTEKFTKEAKLNEEIMDDLQKTKLHLGTLADAIEIKDKELSSLRHYSEELNKRLLQQGQLTDRLRHYEAQNYGTHALQEELQQTKNTISQLTTELNQLKMKEKPLSPLETVQSRVPEAVVKLELKSLDVERDIAEANNSFPVLERDTIHELQKKLAILEVRNKHLEDTLNKAIEADIACASPVGEKQDSNEDSEGIDILDKEAAMKHLEEKFLHTMDEIARLTDEKQRLEHLVLQLQGETETIGEYVALYQHQRSVLKQKTLEKDMQLKQLTEDRAQIKNKLDKLNLLVKQLVLEKGVVPPQLMQQHESHNLCEEHSKIHQEINKITEENFTAGTNQHSNDNTETAEQIIELLTEIKTSNLVQPSENIHPCPWCSGQLITV